MHPPAILRTFLSDIVTWIRIHLVFEGARSAAPEPSTCDSPKSPTLAWKFWSTKILSDLRSKKFIYYLERHIELDGNDHGPIALKMINNLCGEDISKWDDVIDIANKSMEMRIKLWNHINNQI